MDNSTRNDSIIKIDEKYINNTYLHHTIPSIVLNSYYKDEPTGDSETVNCVSSLPVPFDKPTLITEEILNGVDPATELVISKRKWISNRDRLISANIKSKNCEIPRKKRKNTYFKIPVPLGTLRLAEHIEKDPDPYFSSPEYNWYYTDGCLSTLRTNNHKLLLSARHSVPGIVVVKPICEVENNVLYSNDNEFFLHTETTQPILQLSTWNDLICCRQRNSSSLFRLNKEEVIEVTRCHRHESTNDAIVSIAIDHNSRGEYCTFSSSKIIEIWKPEWKAVCKMRSKLEYDKSYGWGNVKYLRSKPNTIAIADRNSVYLRDLRYNLSENNGTRWPKKYVEPCEEICQLILSSELVYVATTHQIFELDIRKGFTKRWTHLMTSQPLFGFSKYLSNCEEFIFVGSQNMNDLCCVAVNSQKVPTILPCPNETLINARFRGSCLDPCLSVRSNLSMTGLTHIQSEDDFYLIRSTSIGDVFYQKICTGNKDSQLDLNINILNEWELACKKSNQNLSNKTLNVTNIKNNTKLFNAILKKSKRLPRKRQVYKKYLRSPWKMSKKELMLNVTDSFSECLLDVWDIEDEPEWDDKKQDIVDDEGLHAVEDVGSRVSNWLQFKNNSIFTNVKEVEPIDRIHEQNIIMEDTNKGCTESDVQQTKPCPLSLDNRFRRADILFDDEFDQDEMIDITPVSKPKKSLPTNFNHTNNRFSSGF